MPIPTYPGLTSALAGTRVEITVLAAARHGVTIMAGSSACADGQHREFVRLSFAEQPSTLELAAERLAAAWETHAGNLAASPVRS